MAVLNTFNLVLSVIDCQFSGFLNKSVVLFS